MKTRALISAMLLVAIVLSLGACSKSEQGLDVAGLKLGKDLTNLLGEATGILGDVKDLDSAKAALPKLMELDHGLDGIIAKVADLSPESKNSLAGMVKTALPKLEGSMEQITSNPAIGQTLKPALDSIMTKVKGLI